VNVPLAAGGGDEEWLAALDTTILPAVERFAPELLVVSAGFDAWRGDPLGGMRVSEAGYAAIGRRLGELAARTAAGRMIVVLEGGYDVTALPRLARALLTGREAAPGG
jgi:acetoin utilization deacetylase AcuC-like enzyme